MALVIWMLPAVAGCAADDLPAGGQGKSGGLTLPGVTFQTVLQPRFVGAQNNGGGSVIATATVAQAWETFSLDDINGGDLESGDPVFIHAGNGQLFQAMNGGGSTLNAASSNLLQWETFKVVKQSGTGAIKNGDVVGLQAFSGAWVSAQNGGGGPVFAYGGALGAWEQLRVGGLPAPVGGGGAGGGGGNASGGGVGGGNASGGNVSGDIVGKITVGYQGWFNAPGDGSGINPPWWHWTPDRNTPTPNNTGIRSWPDVRDLPRTYQTGFANLGNGRPATLYSNWDASTVETQVRWMQETGIDTIALQRFGDFRGRGEARNVVSANVRAAAEAHGRKFYIMYDITGWWTFHGDLPADWVDHIENELHLTESPAYARQNGKPVVCIWGFGFLDRPGTARETQDVIDFFHARGMYVIGGLGNDWRTADGTRWSKAGFLGVYDTLDAISPWMVGVIGDAAGSDFNRRWFNEGDVRYLHAHGKHYQPCVLPGDLKEHQRRHGDFMWHQFFNMIEIGSDGLYISMYDEYNEGNQIAKTAPTAADVPAGSGIVPLDEDGVSCSSDYYLRLTGDGGRMLRKQLPLTPVRPTPTL